MKRILQAALSLPLAGIALFCIFGFLATYEPLARDLQITWRIVYAGAGLACLGGLIRIWGKRRS